MASPAQVGSLVTGLVVAVRGCELSGGDFRIDDLAFPQPAPAIPRSIAPKHRYVALASGLSIGAATPTSPIALHMLWCFLTGMLGSHMDQQEEASVVRLIIAGGLLAEGTLTALSAPSTVEVLYISIERERERDREVPPTHTPVHAFA